MPKVTAQFTITADAETLEKFTRLLGLMHFNAGHSGLFAIDFDGDGHDRLRVHAFDDVDVFSEDEADSLRKQVHAIGDMGADVEVARHGYFEGLKVDWSKGRLKP
jgi:hypothetical protein